MSRTYRRKNFEDVNRSSWDNNFRNQIGFYRGSNYWKDEDGRYCRDITPQRLTDHEFAKKYWRVHSDKGFREFSTFYKRPTKRKFRHDVRLCLKKSAGLEEIMIPSYVDWKVIAWWFS